MIDKPGLVFPKATDWRLNVMGTSGWTVNSGRPRDGKRNDSDGIRKYGDGRRDL
jgi:hypothetical protein